MCDKCFDEVTSGTAKVSLLIAGLLNNRMNLHDTEGNTFDSQVGKKLEKQIKLFKIGKKSENFTLIQGKFTSLKKVREK